MPTNWAELKFGHRFIKLASAARDRVRQRHPERNAEEIKQRRRHYIYKVLSDSAFNKLSHQIGAFIGLCILFSTISFILETVPEYARSPFWRQVFFGAEIFFVTVFSVEMGVRFWAFPDDTKTFFKDPMNIVDVVSIAPFYIEILLIAVMGSGALMMDLRVLRAFRLMRMMKMGRFSGELALLGQGLWRSKGAFLLLCCTLVLGTVFFSALMWTVERGTWEPGQQCYAREGEPFMNGCSPFASVPVGFWWAITSMTTVGYGDTFPLTPVGKVIAGIAMLAGIFCVALPTGILCTQFALLYDEQKHVVRKPDPAERSMALRPKEELELFLSSESLGELRNAIDAHFEYMYCLSQLYGQDHSNVKEDLKEPFGLYKTFHNQAVSGIDSMKEVLHSVTEELRAPTVPFQHTPHSPHHSPRYM